MAKELALRLRDFEKAFTPRPHGPASAIDRLPPELRDAVAGYYTECVKGGKRPDHAMLAGWLKAEGHAISRERLGCHFRMHYGA